MKFTNILTNLGAKFYLEATQSLDSFMFQLPYMFHHDSRTQSGKYRIIVYIYTVPHNNKTPQKCENICHRWREITTICFSWNRFLHQHIECWTNNDRQCDCAGVIHYYITRLIYLTALFDPRHKPVVHHSSILTHPKLVCRRLPVIAAIDRSIS